MRLLHRDVRLQLFVAVMLVSGEGYFLDFMFLAFRDVVGDQLSVCRIVDVGSDLYLEKALVLKVQLNATSAFIDEIGIGGIGRVNGDEVPDLALAQLRARGF